MRASSFSAPTSTSTSSPAQTTGFVGADLANLCNEAALHRLAARPRRGDTWRIFEDAFERVIGGLEKKGTVLNPRERRIVAYHESGHTLVGYFTPGADPVQKVSIVPRGRGALGYTLQAPLEDRFLLSEQELRGRLRTLLGGRAAEEVVFGEISTGASDDLEKASNMVRQMLTVYGMSKRLPNLSLAENAQGGFLGQGARDMPHSDAIEQTIGEEMLQSCCGRPTRRRRRSLTERRAQLEALATRLLAQEKVDEKDLLEVLGPRPHRRRHARGTVRGRAGRCTAATPSRPRSARRGRPRSPVGRIVEDGLAVGRTDEPIAARHLGVELAGTPAGVAGVGAHRFAARRCSCAARRGCRWRRRDRRRAPTAAARWRVRTSSTMRSRATGPPRKTTSLRLRSSFTSGSALDERARRSGG